MLCNYSTAIFHGACIIIVNNVKYTSKAIADYNNMFTEKYCLLLYWMFAFHLSNFDGRNCILYGVMTVTDSCKEYRARMD